MELPRGVGMPRSSSTSLLRLKEARIPESEREPVDLAMQRKQQRLERMHTPAGQRRLQRILTAPAPGRPTGS